MWENSNKIINKFKNQIKTIEDIREYAIEQIECGFISIEGEIAKWEKCTISEEGDYYDIKQTRHTVYKKLCDNYDGSYGEVADIHEAIEQDLVEYLLERNYIQEGTVFFKNTQVMDRAKQISDEFKKGE